ncbi:MAG: hypothetical protein R3E96_15215 [Planctomycetota bacterium]
MASTSFLAISDAALLWCKAGVLFFFLGFFAMVLLRVLTRSEADYAEDAALALHEAKVINDRKGVSHE